MTSSIVAWVNGQPAHTLSVRDRGLQFGDGVFETIGVRDGKPLLWDRHERRLYRGLARLGIQPPPEDSLRKEVFRACAGASRAALKVIVTRGSSARGYVSSGDEVPTRIISLAAWPEYPRDYAVRGIAVRWCHTRLGRNRRLAGIKHLNRLEQILARAEWRDEYAEGLMLDENGCVIEGTMANIFVVSNGIVLTPDLSNCGVEGVMRELVLERAEAFGLPFRITTLNRPDIEYAQEMFVTNSLIGLWPVRRCEGATYTIGKITQALQEAVRDQVYVQELV